jgi:aminopeptidase S
VNLDMVGSRMGRPFVYDESGSPPGSRAIRDALADALERRGRPPAVEDMRGGSDHAPFAEAGIPVGGIYTGSSDAPLAVGGPAASPVVYDPCYHLACDRIDNVNLALLHATASAAAEAVVALAGN